MTASTCTRCGHPLDTRALIRVPLAATTITGAPPGLLEAPDVNGNATALICRARQACQRRQRRHRRQRGAA